jgi:seryl-tRNA synthetase
MEAELLRGMIADRDARMEKIKRKTEEVAGRYLQLCQQLEEVSEQVAEQTAKITSDRNALMRQYKTVVDKLDQLQRDFKQQGASLQTYSKDSFVTKIGNDTSYVMRMQAQLCKAMHSLGITDHQMELAQKHAEAIAKYQKEMLVQCREEHTATELGLMNQLIVKDNERREIEDSLLAKLEVISKERDALERQLEESGHDLEEDENVDDDEDEDDEEKAEKEELMQLLSERRAEIDRLEQLEEEQEELIAELEEQLAEMAGSGTITQRKSHALVEEELRLPDIADEAVDDEDEDEDEVPEDHGGADETESDVVDDDDHEAETNDVNEKVDAANGEMIHDAPEEELKSFESTKVVSAEEPQVTAPDTDVEKDDVDDD